MKQEVLLLDYTEVWVAGLILLTFPVALIISGVRRHERGPASLVLGAMLAVIGVLLTGTVDRAVVIEPDRVVVINGFHLPSAAFRRGEVTAVRECEGFPRGVARDLCIDLDFGGSYHLRPLDQEAAGDAMAAQLGLTRRTQPDGALRWER